MDDGRERRGCHGGHDAKTKVDEATVCVEMPRGDGTRRLRTSISELYPRRAFSEAESFRPPISGFRVRDEQTVVSGCGGDFRFSRAAPA